MDLIERRKADEIRGRFNERHRALIDDRDLTDEARRRRLAEEYVTARRELEELRKADAARLAARERDLERKLFGSPSAAGADAVSARDAQDRASQLDSPEAAAALLRQAEQNDDQALARAVTKRAVQMSREALTRDAVAAWDAVAGEFIDARPQLLPIVEELAQIERLGAREVFSPFSLAQPAGLLPQDVNQANDPGAASMAFSGTLREGA